MPAAAELSRFAGGDTEWLGSRPRSNFLLEAAAATAAAASVVVDVCMSLDDAAEAATAAAIAAAWAPRS